MLLTKLLSLNVHDAMTFEGTELCLHPDLFQPSSSAGHPSSASTSLSGIAGSSIKPRLSVASFGGSATGAASSIGGASGAPPIGQSHSDDTSVFGGSRASINANDMSTHNSHHQSHHQSHQHQSSPSQPQQQQQQRAKLAVGDMIEIRIWDPMTKDEIKAATTTTATTTMKMATTSPTSNSTLRRSGITSMPIHSPSLSFSASASASASTSVSIPPPMSASTSTSTPANPLATNNHLSITSSNSSFVDVQVASSSNLSISPGSPPRQSPPSSAASSQTSERRTRHSSIAQTATQGRPRGVSAVSINTQNSLQYSEASSNSRQRQRRSGAQVASPSSTAAPNNDLQSSALPPVFPRSSQRNSNNTTTNNNTTNNNNNNNTASTSGPFSLLRPGGWAFGGSATNNNTNNHNHNNRDENNAITAITTNNSNSNSNSNSNINTNRGRYPPPSRHDNRGIHNPSPFANSQQYRFLPAPPANVSINPLSVFARTGAGGNSSMDQKSPPTSRHVRNFSDVTFDSQATPAFESADPQSPSLQRHQQHYQNQPPHPHQNASQHQPFQHQNLIQHHQPHHQHQAQQQYQQPQQQHQQSPFHRIQPGFVAPHDDIVAADNALNEIMRTHRLRKSFVILVTSKMISTLKGSSRTQISMLRQVADLYELSSYDMVTVHKVHPADEPQVLKKVSVDFVVLMFKDQFLSRADMHMFREAMTGSWIYEGQRLRLEARSADAHAKRIKHGKAVVRSGIVTENTKITFRSRSARIVWLVQLSSEMWDYTSPYMYNQHEDAQYHQHHQQNQQQYQHMASGQPAPAAHHSEPICELYFDRWIRFVETLFAKWKELDVTHSLTVIFFSRTLMHKQESRAGTKDIYGRSYEDNYKTILENETSTDWESLIVSIKEAFVRWPIDLGWDLKTRMPSNAIQGNLLEAINITLNVMQFHFLDRDLHRTGNSIVVISAGNGVFEVDKRLASISYQRMMDNGIGSDMLSLGLPPLHIAPFFLYSEEYMKAKKHGVDTSKSYYEIPHWMNLSFIAYDSEEEPLVYDQAPAGSSLGATQSPPPSSQRLADSDRMISGFQSPRRGGTMSDRPNSRPASPTLRVKVPSAFPLAGSTFGPRKQEIMTQERQLISGRSFRDILEACRPRLSGDSLPSALSMLLKAHMYATGISEGKSPKSLKQIFQEKSDRFHGWSEWGTMTVADVVTRMKEVKRQNRIQRLILRDSSRGSPLDDFSDSVSIASGAASQLSSMYGMSFDGSTWMRSGSPSTKFSSVLQIQRSPSLEFDTVHKDSTAHKFDDTDSTHSDDDRSNGSASTIRSAMDARFQDGNNTSNHQRSKPAPHGPAKETHAERLRRIMRSRDSNYFKCSRIKDVESKDVDLMYPDSDLVVDKGVADTNKETENGAATGGVGGLRAALSQYSNDQPFGSEPNSNPNVNASSTNMSSNNSHGSAAQLPATAAGYDPDMSRGGIQTYSTNAMLQNRPMQRQMSNWERRSSSPSPLALAAGVKAGGISDAPQAPSGLPHRLIPPNGGNIMKGPPPTISGPRQFPMRAGPSSRAASAGDIQQNTRIPTVFGSVNVTNRAYNHVQPQVQQSLANGPAPALSGQATFPVRLVPAGPAATSSVNATNRRGLMTDGSRMPKTKKIAIKRTEPGLGRPQPTSPDEKAKGTKQNRSTHSSRTVAGSPASSPPSIRSRGIVDASRRHNSSPISRAASQRRRTTKSKSERAVNPFRQSDEDVVIAIKSHNRRRWSHVFPAGEVEFKRHAGPNWKSLTAPAILPLSIDHLPSALEFRGYTTGFHSVSMEGVEKSQYTSHAELLMEMVRQRLTHDYQLVTEAAVKQSSASGEHQRHLTASDRTAGQMQHNRPNHHMHSFVPTQSVIPRQSPGVMTHILSMGHRIQQLTWDARTDGIEILTYSRKGTANDESNKFTYNFLMYSPITQSYWRSQQTFKKYADPYKFSKFDQMLAGHENPGVEEGMRFRRVVYGMVPERFRNHTEEQAYIARFLRLVEYLNKLRQKDASKAPFSVRIVSSRDENSQWPDEVSTMKRTTFDSMIRLNVPLRQGKLGAFEWLELAADAVFDTNRSYRIMFSWLVASSAKVEAQLQMVKRRCSQYGLNLTTFPHISVSEDPFLNAFVVPPSICIKDAAVADQIDDALANSVFVNDGVYFTKSSVLSCIDGSEDYDFSRARAPRNKKKADDENKKSAGVRLTRISSRQFVHRSGSMFVRKLRDQKGWVILVVIPNTQHSSRHDLPKYRRMLRSSFLELCRIIEDLKQQHQRRQREKEKEQEQAQKRERETIQVQKKEREVEQEQALKGMGSTGASGSANDNANISANTNAKAEAEADHRPSALTTRTTDDVAIDTSRKEAKVEE